MDDTEKWACFAGERSGGPRSAQGADESFSSSSPPAEHGAAAAWARTASCLQSGCKQGGREVRPSGRAAAEDQGWFDRPYAAERAQAPSHLRRRRRISGSDSRIETDCRSPLPASPRAGSARRSRRHTMLRRSGAPGGAMPAADTEQYTRGCEPGQFPGVGPARRGLANSGGYPAQPVPDQQHDRAREQPLAAELGRDSAQALHNKGHAVGRVEERCDGHGEQTIRVVREVCNINSRRCLEPFSSTTRTSSRAAHWAAWRSRDTANGRIASPSARNGGLLPLPSLLFSALPPEGWPSGLRRTLGKRVYVNGYRGFESHSLRALAVKALVTREY